MPGFAEAVVMLLALGLAGAVVVLLRRFGGGAPVDGPRPELAPSRDRGPAAVPAAAAGQGQQIVALRPGVPLVEQLRHHAAEAEQRGLRPFVEFGASWCPPSRMFGEVLDDPRMVAAMAGVYLLRADIDAFDGDPLLRAWRVSSVPVFFELDGDGEATGRSITGAAWGADTVDNMAAAMGRFLG